MFSEIYGYRVNLIYVAIAVALYDLFHILYEFKQRFVRFQEYEDTDFGCMSDMFQNHCLATYSEIGVYAIDLIFTCYLIYGASSLKAFPVLCWLLLSSYHLIDFILWFTPIYGSPPLSIDDVGNGIMLDIGVSILGFLYVIYFYKKLLEIERGGIERERLSNVDELNITGVDLEAY